VTAKLTPSGTVDPPGRCWRYSLVTTKVFGVPAIGERWVGDNEGGEKPTIRWLAAGEPAEPDGSGWARPYSVRVPERPAESHYF